MTEPWYYKLQREAAEKLATELRKPIDNGEMDSGDYFDPWSLFPALYGSYDAAFDWCAIDVLEGLGKYDDTVRRDLASDMFREMLCKYDFCEYGTSPRACFPTPQVKELLPQWIGRWKEYYAVQWSEPRPSPPVSRGE